MNTQNNQYLDDYVEKYRDIKEKWLKDFNKSHGTTSKFCKEHCIHGLSRKKPWFILLKRDSIKIESRRKVTKFNHTSSWKGMFNTSCRNGSESTRARLRKTTCSTRSSSQFGKQKRMLQKNILET